MRFHRRSCAPRRRSLTNISSAVHESGYGPKRTSATEAAAKISQAYDLKRGVGYRHEIPTRQDFAGAEEPRSPFNRPTAANGVRNQSIDGVILRNNLGLVAIRHASIYGHEGLWLGLNQFVCILAVCCLIQDSGCDACQSINLHDNKARL